MWQFGGDSIISQEHIITAAELPFGFILRILLSEFRNSYNFRNGCDPQLLNFVLHFSLWIFDEKADFRRFTGIYRMLDFAGGYETNKKLALNSIIETE